MMKKETHEITKFMAHVTTNASNFNWQKYSYDDKFLLIVAYMLRILPKFSFYELSKSITDPDKILEAERRMFLVVQTESNAAEKKN